LERELEQASGQASGLRQRRGKRYCLQVANCLARFRTLICMAFFIFKVVDCSRHTWWIAVPLIEESHGSTELSWMEPYSSKNEV